MIKKLCRFIKDNPFVIVFAVLLIMVKLFLFDLKSVEGISMYPTLNRKVSDDIVALDKTVRFGERYSHEDVIVLKKGDGSGEMVIKRIIGLSGDKIEIKNGYVFRNGEKLQEEYLKEKGKTWPQGNFSIDEGEVFVLGDNRENSQDSREYGTFNLSDIVGKAIFRFNISKLDWNSL